MPGPTDSKTMARRISAKQKREKAVEARARGLTWAQVAAEAGYAHAQSACAAVSEYLDKYPSPAVEELRAVENLKLDRLEQAVLGVLERNHVMISAQGVVRRPKQPLELLRTGDGEVVYKRDGSPMFVMEEIEDDGPVLQAVGQALRVMDRRSKLNGLDMPTKLEIDDGSVDKEIVELVEQMQQAGMPAVPEGHSG